MASNSSRERAQRTAELLKQQQQQAKRRQAGIVGGIMAVLLIVAVGGGWFLLKSDGQPVKPQDSQYGLGVGDDNAPVHMIIYEDFLCPAC
ncbi:MAG: disulfide bond formation protein DsbA, partial [Nocardioidaceae bacterium]|nr:disulfide bond formation protein DsbA [Nocardioidaceae bacterium]